MVRGRGTTPVPCCQRASMPQRVPGRRADRAPLHVYRATPAYAGPTRTCRSAAPASADRRAAGRNAREATGVLDDHRRGAPGVVAPGGSCGRRPARRRLSIVYRAGAVEVDVQIDRLRRAELAPAQLLGRGCPGVCSIAVAPLSVRLAVAAGRSAQHRVDHDVVAVQRHPGGQRAVGGALRTGGVGGGRGERGSARDRGGSGDPATYAHDKTAFPNGRRGGPDLCATPCPSICTQARTVIFTNSSQAMPVTETAITARRPSPLMLTNR